MSAAPRSACSARATRSPTSPTPTSWSRSRPAPARRRGRPRPAGTVSFGAASRYGELAACSHGRGLALHNLASLPHISVAGAVATATHGSGDANGNLATAVAALELVTSTASRPGRPGRRRLRRHRRRARRARRGDADHPRRRAGLRGPPARLRGPRLGRPLEHFDAITAAGYSVSVFTRWGETSTRCGSRAGTDAAGAARRAVRRASPATVDRHPILGLDPDNCTPQLGVPGLWSDRLPHFRMGFTPSAGEELQSEYLRAPRARRRRDRGGAAPGRHARARCCRSPRSARSPPTRCG